MSEVYQKYFGSGDVYSGKARMMRDIKEHKLTGADLSSLIDDLESNSMLTGKPFTPKPKEAWDEDYLNWLSNGHISDYFSRSYLEHYGEVASHLTRKKNRLNLLIVFGAAVAAAFIILLIWFAAHRASGAAQADIPQIHSELQREDVLRAPQTKPQQPGDTLYGVQDLCVGEAQPDTPLNT